MLPILRALATLAWGLWFGGMIALLFFVIRLFRVSHEAAVSAAPVMFGAFATYQLIVGSAAMVLTLLLAYVSRSKLAIIAAVLVATAWLAAWPIHSITLSMESLRQSGQTSGDEFKALHHRSGLLYTGSATCLLLGGFLLPLAPPRRTA